MIYTVWHAAPPPSRAGLAVVAATEEADTGAMGAVAEPAEPPRRSAAPTRWRATGAPGAMLSNPVSEDAMTGVMSYWAAATRSAAFIDTEPEPPFAGWARKTGTSYWLVVECHEPDALWCQEPPPPGAISALPPAYRALAIRAWAWLWWEMPWLRWQRGSGAEFALASAMGGTTQDGSAFLHTIVWRAARPLGGYKFAGDLQATAFPLELLELLGAGGAA